MAIWHVLVGPPLRARDVSREQITPVEHELRGRVAGTFSADPIATPVAEIRSSAEGVMQEALIDQLEARARGTAAPPRPAAQDQWELTVKVIVYGDFNSLHCYLASQRADRLVREGKADVEWCAVEHRPRLPVTGAKPPPGSVSAQDDLAEAAQLAHHTVAFHLRHVFGKLGVTSRVQLARMAAEQTARTSTADV